MAAQIILCHDEADELYRYQLARHLTILERSGLISSWHSGLIAPGEDLGSSVRESLQRADLIVVFLSSDFLSSPRWLELGDKAIEAHHGSGTRIVPVLARPCLWDSSPFRDLEILPRNHQPVTTWGNVDEAWDGIAREIRTLVQTQNHSPGPTANASTSVKQHTKIVSAPQGGLSPESPRERVRLDFLARLEDALTRQRRLHNAGVPDQTLATEILSLKRQLREGGQVRQGDNLGNRYLLLNRIGKGGFATVWEAEDRQLRRRVAVKVLHPTIAEDPEKRNRFFRGARTMSALAHPGIVHVLSAEAEDDGFCYFVMEHVPGGDLHRAVTEGHIERDRIAPLIVQVGEALSAAYDRLRCVHRDVKPHNVLLRMDASPVLTDFDLVSIPETTGGTHTGAFGTFLYAAPELMTRPQDADVRADVFGLGMTAVFCYHGRDIPLTILENKQGFLDRLQCSPQIRAVLRSATASDPEQRFVNMMAFCRALLQAERASAAALSEGVAHGTSSRDTTEGTVEALDHELRVGRIKRAAGESAIFWNADILPPLQFDNLALGDHVQFELDVPGHRRVLARCVRRASRSSSFTSIATGADGTRAEAGTPDISWLCPTCHQYGPWSGAMCLNCGRFSDPND